MCHSGIDSGKYIWIPKELYAIEKCQITKSTWILSIQTILENKSPPQTYFQYSFNYPSAIDVFFDSPSFPPGVS